jgi:hypothetical protein
MGTNDCSVLKFICVFYMYLDIWYLFILFFCFVDSLHFASFGCGSYGVTFLVGMWSSSSCTCMDLFVLCHSWMSIVVKSIIWCLLSIMKWYMCDIYFSNCIILSSFQSSNLVYELVVLLVGAWLHYVPDTMQLAILI